LVGLYLFVIGYNLIPIQRKFYPDKPIKIQFLIKDPKSPMNMGLYGDMQKLGIVIILRSIENRHQRDNLKLKF
jgi:hypothetical protein